MKLLILATMLHCFTALAGNTSETVSLQNPKIFDLACEVTDEPATLKSIYHAQDEHIRKRRIPIYPEFAHHDGQLQMIRHYYEPMKYPNVGTFAPPVFPKDAKHKAAGTYLYKEPNILSSRIGFVSTKFYTGGIHTSCGDRFRRDGVWDVWPPSMGVISSLDGKYYGSVFDDYSAYIGSYWQLPNGEVEEWTKEWCERTKTTQCEGPSLFINDFTVRGVLYAEKEVWYQMPFQIDGVYPWIRNKLTDKNKPPKEITKNKVVSDLIGKSVGFMLYPDYFESLDGEIIYLVNQTLKEKFEGKKVEMIQIKGWGGFIVKKIDSEYMYLDRVISDDPKQPVGQRLKTASVKVKLSLVTRANGTLRLFMYGSGGFSDVYRPLFYIK